MQCAYVKHVTSAVYCFTFAVKLLLMSSAHFFVLFFSQAVWLCSIDNFRTFDVWYLGVTFVFL